MANNQTTVTLTKAATYVPSVPISYASLTMIDEVEDQDQLLLFRQDIEERYGSTLSIREYREMGIIPSSWITLDKIAKTITAITIPSTARFKMDDNFEVEYPAMASGENIEVRRQNIIAEPYVKWVTGSRITADQLNLEVNHLLGLIQETSAKANAAVYRDDNDVVSNPLAHSLDANGNKITNLSDPTSNQDGATKYYVDHLISSQKGAINGIATLDADGLIPTAQLPNAAGNLPGTFFARSTKPTRSSTGNGLFKWGSLWYNTTNGRLYIYTPDDNYGSATEATDAEVGYWVDVSAPI